MPTHFFFLFNFFFSSKNKKNCDYDKNFGYSYPTIKTSSYGMFLYTFTHEVIQQIRKKKPILYLK